MVCCSFSCQGSYAHTVSHTTGKKSTESSRLVQIFKVLRHQQCLLNFRHCARLCNGVFEAESNNQSVHFHRDIFCRLRVSGMLPIIHCLLITHLRNFGLCGDYSGWRGQCGCFPGWLILWPHSRTQGQTGCECCSSDDSFLHIASSIPDMERELDLFDVQRETERSFSY